MSRHYGDPTTDAPAPPALEDMYDPSSTLRNALYEYSRMYGPDGLADLEYLVSSRVYSALYLELFQYTSKMVEINRPNLVSFLGFPIRVDGKLTNTSCILVAGENEYHFEIPETARKRKPPRPDPNITPMYRNSFGAFDFIGRGVLAVIDWLNRLAGAEKPKRKYKHDEIEITVLEERMQRCRAMEIGVIGKALDCSDCYSKCEEWYNVAEKTKAKTNGEQMATLGELFEGYEEDGIPRAYQSSHKGWFNPDCPCGLLECVCHLAQETK